MPPVLTDRLRLLPIGPDLAGDLWLAHQDDDVARWYAGRWSRDEAERAAAAMGRAWHDDGVHKWLAYARDSGELVGRGGLSYAEVDGRRRLEVGWAVRSPHQGRGYATEIGRAGLAHAFGELAATEVVAFTERHNHRSRAVMRRLAMTYVGEIRRPGLLPGRPGVHDDAPFALYAAGPQPTP
ncbi:GNAT family N-acetyltransferase [Actinocatenispora rupis]|uniref:GNAT family N-acetyltransferase n=1 Tax=Actinocatenispora rupis TaxID=519421 RepID=UPI001944FF31|nr:GNAT family N-acetyltransferase [Actinocatenispora rupis]